MALRTPPRDPHDPTRPETAQEGSLRDLYRRARKHPFIDLLVTLAIAAGIAFVVQLWIVKPFRIPSGSMLQTFHLNDRIIAARFWYHLRDPQRGDIIVFHPNGIGNDAERIQGRVASVVFVKRLIGLPGDWIQARGGKVQICKREGADCKTLNEPYVSSPQTDFGPEQVPKGRYFMMGDNRDDSDDSRSWGPIARSQIIGRAFMIYWPLTRISFF
jgi:signal peptidase I